MLFLMTFLAVRADVIIQPRVRNTFRFTADDIWNINVQFTGTGTPQVIIESSIRSKQGLVLQAKSNATVLKTGLNSFTSISLGTSQLSYVNADMANAVSLLGSLPPGSYTICYRIQCIDPQCNGAGVQAVRSETGDCSDLIVEPSTPLLLSFPEDQSVLYINHNRPTFSWIPPNPISQLSSFNYQYTLTVAREGQSCKDAIQRNRPAYRQAGLSSHVLPYPAELNGLELEKKYCWQVHGLSGKLPVAQSEVWELRLKEEKEDSIPLTYHRLTLNHVKTFEIPKKFGVLHQEKKRSNSLVYTILDLESNIPVKSGELDVVYGENKIDFDLSDLFKAGSGKLFQLQIMNAGKMTSQMKFKFQ